MVVWQAGGLELGLDILRGRVVLGGACPVRRGGERLQVFAGEPCIRHPQEDVVPAKLRRRVSKAKDRERR